MLNKIKTYGRRFLVFVRKPKGAVLTGVALIALFLFFSSMQNNPLAAYDIGEVVRKDVVSIVDVTGRVKPSERVDIALERSGKVARIYTAVGDDVQRGDLILSAAGADLYASLASAQSDLEIERLELEAILKTSAIDLSSAEEDLIDAMGNAYFKADDAVKNEAEQLFYGPADSKSFGAIVDTGGTEIIFGADVSDASSLRTQRKFIFKDLEAWQSYLQDPAGLDIEEAADNVEGYLISVQSFLSDIAAIINAYYATSVSNTIVAGYRSDIAAARTAISTALTAFRTAKQAYLTVEAGSSNSSSEQLQDVLLQEQRVKSAEAQVNAVYAEIERSSIRAPFSGVVTRIDTEVGEMLSAGSAVVSVMSASQFEIETFIPEADIASVALNNKAEITLDAYDSDTIFGAYVSFIDPAETMVEGVATYKVLLSFETEDERIRSGMTANVDIITNTSSGALSVPQRAVIEKDGKRYVRVVRGDKTEEVEVQTGLKGFDGDTEILEGLNEGDQIVVFTRG
ncbi:MAG: efflux RND transporter periplasmic adaptor subunit [Candidatus Colwellbacteria bacterium]|nr:efflux RND transporter periplasmic adaptor subunit [Candidatus Colwellbacteria bacterium]